MQQQNRMDLDTHCQWLQLQADDYSAWVSLHTLRKHPESLLAGLADTVLSHGSDRLRLDMSPDVAQEVVSVLRLGEGYVPPTDHRLVAALQVCGVVPHTLHASGRKATAMGFQHHEVSRGRALQCIFVGVGVIVGLNVLSRLRTCNPPYTWRRCALLVTRRKKKTPQYMPCSCPSCAAVTLELSFPFLGVC